MYHFHTGPMPVRIRVSTRRQHSIVTAAAFKLLSLGGEVVFESGKFCISPSTEAEIFRQFNNAGMVAEDGVHLPYPPHFRNVEIEVDLGAGSESATVYGSDLTLEYVRINADYRS